MGKLTVFISHSSEDLQAARAIAKILRESDIDPWLDDERIGPGDSIPGRIEEGLSSCDVILVLISESFVRSRWCRAEYEPLLSREIESGRTLVIPVRLDNAEVPALLSAKRITDLRGGVRGAGIEQIAAAIAEGRSAAVIRRLLPADAETASYESSMLTMIISKVLRDYPVAVISRETIVRGRSILDLYRTVETLIMNYEDLCDEIVDLLADGDVDRGFYIRASQQYGRIRRVNRRLLDIANDMRDISTALDGIIDPRSPLHQRLTDVLQLCTQISEIEDALLISIDAPFVLPDQASGDRYWRRWSAESTAASFADGGMVHDLEDVLTELNAYKAQLRRAVAAARDEP